MTTTKLEDQLLPCPFCGGEKAVVERDDIVDHLITNVDEENGPIYYVECQQCCAQGPVASWAIDARDAWRKRARPVVDDAMVQVALFTFWSDLPQSTVWQFDQKARQTAGELMRAALEAALQVPERSEEEVWRGH